MTRPVPTFQARCPHGKATRHLCKWCLAYDDIKPEYHCLIDKARAYEAAEEAYNGGHPDELEDA